MKSLGYGKIIIGLRSSPEEPCLTVGPKTKRLPAGRQVPHNRDLNPGVREELRK